MIQSEQRAPKRITVDEMTSKQRRAWITRLFDNPAFARILDKLMSEPDERRAA